VRLREFVREAPREAREFSLPGPFPLPPQFEQGIRPGRDLARASGRAPDYVRIRALTRCGTASLPDGAQLRTVVLDDVSGARIGCPVPRPGDRR
jgi:hypothetical protein